MCPRCECEVCYPYCEVDEFDIGEDYEKYRCANCGHIFDEIEEAENAGDDNWSDDPDMGDQ